MFFIRKRIVYKGNIYSFPMPLLTASFLFIKIASSLVMYRIVINFLYLTKKRKRITNYET